MAEESKVEVLRLYFYGESLLYSDLLKALELSCWRFKVILCTNGALLTEKIARELVQLNIHEVEFSHTGWTHDVFRHFQGHERPAGLIHRIRQNIERYLTLNRASRTPARTVLWYVLDEHSRLEALTYAQQWETLVDDIWFTYLQPMFGQIAPLPHVERYASCGFLGHTLTVLADGRVTTCCYDYNGENTVGSLEQQRLADIIEGPTYQRFLVANANTHLAQLPRLCNSCIHLMSERCLAFNWKSVKALRGLVGRLPAAVYAVLGSGDVPSHLLNALRVFRPKLSPPDWIAPDTAGSHFGRPILLAPTPSHELLLQVQDRYGVSCLDVRRLGAQGWESVSVEAIYPPWDSVALVVNQALAAHPNARIALWGAGPGAMKALSFTNLRIEKKRVVVCFDSNPSLAGLQIDGVRVGSPPGNMETLTEHIDLIIITSVYSTAQIYDCIRPFEQRRGHIVKPFAGFLEIT
jgi:hypothetical protein